MDGLLFSVIIPVFNRPGELRELLESLVNQTYKNFEVLVIEDGSTISSVAVAEEFSLQLTLNYFTKPNEGPGLTRNFGAGKAKGNYFIFFDSDCLIPEKYIETVHTFLSQHWLDAYGGPDAAHASFSPIQKAISYSMTSVLTTGGIRGGNIDPDKFHPRSFNMGISKDVFSKTGGFANMRFGEDLDLSMRIKETGAHTGLIKDAFVYHKRRTDFRKFFKQVYNSGIARINLFKRHPGSLKLVHFFPAAFVFFTGFCILCLAAGWWQPFVLLLFYSLAILINATLQYKSLTVGFLSVEASFVQHFAYGSGFIKSFWKRIILGKPEFDAYRDNFYK